MGIILSHPTGNSFVRAAAKGMMDSHVLDQFYTAIASFPGTAIDKLGGLSSLQEIRRRRFDQRLQSITTTSPLYEAGRLLSSKLRLTSLVEHEKGIFSVDSVYRNLDKKVASALKQSSHGKADAVYAYEDGAYYTFKAAKKLALTTHYDLPIGYWRTARKLLQAEKERWPDWSETIIGFGDSNAKLDRKDEELKMADKIFVASQFTANTLQDFPGILAPIHVVPYGFPPVVKNKVYTPLAGRPLKLLFVGSLSQRKGIAELFAAVARFGKQVELTVVGYKTASNCVVLNAALEKHTWIPSLSHAEVLQLMNAHDVVVFPSLFEGFGLVITEAMSQGTPVITTDRTAGPDLINHGENGWLIPAGSTNGLIGGIENILINPRQVESAGRAAMETARLRPWEVYGKELVAAILS
jgi:glycosyltransferase involved in cell wall biosynthesis